MVKDRLAEMQAKCADTGSSTSKKTETHGKALVSSEQQLEECLAKVSKIDNKIKSMRTEVEQMCIVQKNIMSSPIIHKNEVQNLDKISDNIFATSGEIQKEINCFRSDIAEMNMDNTHNKMVKTQLDRLNSSVIKAMNDFRAAQVEYIKKTQKLRNIMVEIVTGEAIGSDQPVDLSSIQAVFAGDYFSEAEKTKNELQEIDSRHVEIKKLETSVEEVNRLFKEINTLVMEQGQVIDTIEKHVTDTSVTIEAGNVQLKQARRHMDSARRKKVCCCGIIIAILVIAAIVITIVLVDKQNK